MSKSLGFSIAAYREGLPLLRGCLASIKHFAPDAPFGSGALATEIRTLNRLQGA